ncbi:unnamed protein product [Aureobasidium vineae]|uniref:Uncharacterized protein n=1 Tax=Aureobasidium vineae TaxID=2773715 RepID=A0A9N8JUR7_9PEZI|nr:unnamed protein product [Aureobasidium vineae]
MAPTSRSSTKKVTVVDTRDIVSWTSVVTGEKIFYERFHEYDEEGEVLFVQLRMDEEGELIPWTKDEEDEEQALEMSDNNSVEEGEVDPDFVSEVTRAADEDHVAAQSNAQEAPKKKRAPTKRRQTTKVNKTTPHPTASLSAALLAVASVVDLVSDMTDLVQHEFILDFVAGPASEAVLQSTSQNSLSSMLKNFRVSDLSEVNGARAHAIEKGAYDSVRPGKLVNNRWVLNPRPIIFRPTNPELFLCFPHAGADEKITKATVEWYRTIDGRVAYAFEMLRVHDMWTEQLVLIEALEERSTFSIIPTDQIARPCRMVAIVMQEMEAGIFARPLQLVVVGDVDMDPKIWMDAYTVAHDTGYQYLTNADVIFVTIDRLKKLVASRAVGLSSLKRIVIDEPLYIKKPTWIILGALFRHPDMNPGVAAVFVGRKASLDEDTTSKIRNFATHTLPYWHAHTDESRAQAQAEWDAYAESV